MQMRRLLAGGLPGCFPQGIGELEQVVLHRVPRGVVCSHRTAQLSLPLCWHIWNVTSGPRLLSSINADMQLPRPTNGPPDSGWYPHRKPTKPDKASRVHPTPPSKWAKNVMQETRTVGGESGPREAARDLDPRLATAQVEGGKGTQQATCLCSSFSSLIFYRQKSGGSSPGGGCTPVRRT